MILKREKRSDFDLRESGSIEQDADIVMLLENKEKEKTSEKLIKIKMLKSNEDYEPISLLAKQRNGPTGRINLAFRRKFTRFEVLKENQD